MIDIDIQLSGATGAKRTLSRGTKLEDVIGRELGNWAQDVLDDHLYGEDKYAPPPPNSKYIRTGRLGRGYGLMRHSRTAVRIFNLTPYTGYVVGDAAWQGQAAIHAGRWWLARQRVEARLDDATERIGRAIERELR
jgi:hypothetical protein